MNSVLSLPVVSSASFFSRSARSTRVESVTSRYDRRTFPSGSGTVATRSTEPSCRSSVPSLAAQAVIRAMTRAFFSDQSLPSS